MCKGFRFSCEAVRSIGPIGVVSARYFATEETIFVSFSVLEFELSFMMNSMMCSMMMCE